MDTILVNNIRRIGFVATRIAGTDGRSLETTTWADVLEEDTLLSDVLQTERPGLNGWPLILGVSLIPALLGALVPGIRFYSSAQSEEDVT